VISSKQSDANGNPGGRTKVSDEIRDLARGYAPAAIIKLAELAGLTEAPGAESEATQLAAINALLDRAYGKPTQPLEGDGDTAPQVVVFQ
jgi:hypothetical protein